MDIFDSCRVLIETLGCFVCVWIKSMSVFAKFIQQHFFYKIQSESKFQKKTNNEESEISSDFYPIYYNHQLPIKKDFSV